MAGIYTSRKVVPLKRDLFTTRSSAFPGGGFSHRVDLPDEHTVTSYRTVGRSQDVFVGPDRRDLFEPFYAYGSSKFDNGHPFRVDHRTSVLTHSSFWAQGGTDFTPLVTIKGPLIPNYGVYGAEPLAIDGINTAVYGPRMINDTLPTNPVTNVAQTLAELKREGISLPGVNYAKWLQSRSSFLGTVGGEYLNVAFGYIPLIQSVYDVCQTILKSARILEQLERDAGKVVRRKRSLPVTVLSNAYSSWNDVYWRPPTAGDEFIVNGIFSGWPGSRRGQFGQLERIDRKTEQYSFSGAYTYYFENGIDPISKMRDFEQKANLLLGVRALTPEVLWELTPWSWLSDYFVTFGDLFSNVTRFSSDGLVMKYGYLMRHSVSERIYTQNGISFKSSSPGPFSITLKLERKERVRATPFGFGLNPDSFSVRQWTILAALGLTKSPRNLP